MHSWSDGRRMAAAAGLVGLLALAWYGRTLGFGFVNIDDNLLIAGNAMLRAPLGEALRGFFVPGSMPGEGLYIPITYLTYYAEVQLFGLRPGLMHGTSALLHALNAGLCCWLLWRWSGRAFVAIGGALLFAFHPLQAESVAWLMSRKDLLATAFCLLTLLAWERWRRQHRPRWYALALGLYLLALLSKPSAVVLPAMLIVVDHWHDRRRLLLVTLPFWALAIACWLTTARLAGESADAVLPPLLAAASVPRVIGDWLLRVLLLASPAGYYHKSALLEPHAWGPLAWLLPLGLLFAALIHGWRRRQRGDHAILAGLLLAGLAIAPAVVIVFGDRAFAFGDRYGYLAMPGLALAAAAWIGAASRWRRPLLALLLIVCLVRGWFSIGTWEDSFTLWAEALRHDPDNPVALVALGNAYDVANQPARAAAQYRQTLRLAPRTGDAYNNLAAILQTHGHLAEAERLYRHALALAPTDPQLHYHLALVANMQGKAAIAMTHSNRALELRPAFPDALVNRAMLHLDADELAKAEADLQAALAIDPAHLNARYYLAEVAAARQQWRTAVDRYRAILADGPAQAHIGLANALHAQGKTPAAIQALQQADKRHPNHPLIQMAAARLLLEAGRPDLARGAYDAAVRFGHPRDLDLETRLPASP